MLNAQIYNIFGVCVLMMNFMGELYNQLADEKFLGILFKVCYPRSFSHGMMGAALGCPEQFVHGWIEPDS